MRLKPKQIFQIARLVIRGVTTALDEVESAKDPSSPGGKRVTTQEAMEVASAVMASLVEPISAILADDPTQ